MKKRDVIIACDFASAAETFRFLDRFESEKPFVKIGMELYYAEGPAIVREIRTVSRSLPPSRAWMPPSIPK